MEKVIDTYNALVGGLVALLIAVFGVFWYLFAGYALLNVIDWLTGWWKARKQGKESSKVGWRGAAKKVGYWCLIAAAFVVANVLSHLGSDLLGLDLSFLSVIGWFTLASLFVNEARSICENFVEMGFNVPEFFIKGLKVTAEMIDKSASK